MKVSLNWVKEYIDFDLPPVEELVEVIGAQLGAVEEVIDLGAKYQGIIIVKVVECQPMEGSDHLSICKIDDGNVAKDVERDANGLVQVVCGAPNVKAGVLVAWLPPGSTVPSSVGEAEPFVLSAKPLRGVVSNGMLASPKELAMSDNHEGLLLIDQDCQPGADFAETFKLNDYIIDIENKMFTHRPDCFGIIGVAREIAGILGHQFVSPDWYRNFTDKLEPSGAALPLTIKNELPSLVPRFTAVVISQTDIQPSSIWYQTYLSRVGVRPISNVVDITNYMMLLTGQPLHAYDYDKVKALSGEAGATLVIRNPRPDEKLQLLNGKVINPRQEAIIIATDKQPIGLGGVMGGAETEVDAQTKNIILECASFDMYSIRRTSMAHGLFTDAVSRFNKGQSPLQTDRVLVQAGGMLCVGSTQYAGAIVDDNHLDQVVLSRQSLYPAVKVGVSFINDRLGVELSAEDMKLLLEHTEFVVNINADELEVTAPFWRTDIELREDVVEEIGRLYGYDKLPLTLPTRDLTPPVKDQLLDLKAAIRSHLATAGANEVLTYSFAHGELLTKARQDSDSAFRLSNAISPDLQYYRLSLTPSLLEKVHPNIKAGYDQFALFEVGKVHLIDELDEHELPTEFERLAVVYAADAKAAQQRGGAAYYQARRYLINLFSSFTSANEIRLRPLISADLSKHKPLEQLSRAYEPNRAAVIYDGDELIGVIGEYRASVRKLLKLPEYCAGFEIDLTALQNESPNQYVPLPRFPKVTQDISLKVGAEIPYQELYDAVWTACVDNRPANSWVALAPLDIYQRSEDTAHKQIALRLNIANYDRTLTDGEVNNLLEAAAAAAKAKFGAERL